MTENAWDSGSSKTFSHFGHLLSQLCINIPKRHTFNYIDEYKGAHLWTRNGKKFPATRQPHLISQQWVHSSEKVAIHSFRLKSVQCFGNDLSDIIEELTLSAEHKNGNLAVHKAREKSILCPKKSKFAIKQMGGNMLLKRSSEHKVELDHDC